MLCKLLAAIREARRQRTLAAIRKYRQRATRAYLRTGTLPDLQKERIQLKRLYRRLNT